MQKRVLFVDDEPAIRGIFEMLSPFLGEQTSISTAGSGREALKLISETRFDVIVSDLFVPWEGRTGYLYTVEHYRSARERLRPQVRLKTRAAEGKWRSALPKDATLADGHWAFELPKTGIEPLLKALLEGGAGIEELSVERRGLHDAFVAIAGESAAREMEANEAESLGDAA